MERRVLISPASETEEQNWLLAGLSADEHATVAAAAENVTLEKGDVLIKPHVPIDHAWFPSHGVLSVTSVMGNGDHIEVGTIGNEGMVSVSLLLGIDVVPTETMVQIPGAARCIPSAAFRQLLRDVPSLHDVMCRYSQAWTNQVSRGGACNSVHSVNERCARWLLLTHDRACADVFGLTHEFLAVMLGVRRASVTVALGALQKAGIISYRHGKVQVIDRARLEAASCECYDAIQQSYTSLLATRDVTRSRA